MAAWKQHLATAARIIIQAPASSAGKTLHAWPRERHYNCTSKQHHLTHSSMGTMLCLCSKEAFWRPCHLCGLRHPRSTQRRWQRCT